MAQNFTNLEQQIAVFGVFATRLDDAGGGVTYVGLAEAGTVTSASEWQIKRITEVGDDLQIEFADGDSEFDNVWDNRASLSYS